VAAAGFERCDKHIGHFVQIKAQVLGRRKCFRRLPGSFGIKKAVWLPQCNNLVSMPELAIV
jgi:hypothetical protein